MCINWNILSWICAEEKAGEKRWKVSHCSMCRLALNSLFPLLCYTRAAVKPVWHKPPVFCSIRGRGVCLAGFCLSETGFQPGLSLSAIFQHCPLVPSFCSPLSGNQRASREHMIPSLCSHLGLIFLALLRSCLFQ